MCIDATAGRDADPELARAGLLDISTARGSDGHEIVLPSGS
jgi:hypothetical protein